MSITLIVCIAGLLVWFAATRKTFADGMIAEAGKISFAIGLFFWLLAGKTL